jgi:DNA replication and repair protein RecF
MIFTRIEITNFRNITRLTLAPQRGINLFLGRNGQGKSNLLEALDFVCTGRSFRTTKEGDIITWSQNFTRVESEFSAQDEMTSIAMVLVREREHVKKRLTMNGAVVKKLSQFLGTVKSVNFSRHDLETVAGPPHFRRQFLDHILSMINARYLFTLQRYSAVLRERNNWLRCSSGKRPHDAICEVWNEQLAHYGSLIIRERMDMVARLGSIASTIFDRFSSDKGRFTLHYRSSFPVEGPVYEDIHRRFTHYLRKHRVLEEERRATLIGPHRDDLIMKLSSRYLRTFGSQGQQRFASIVLKLSEGHFIEEESGVSPIILLDDCFSELDRFATHRIGEYLMEKAQVFITSNAHPLLELSGGSCTIYDIVEGRITSSVQES